ncbi:5-formyltetrahydrofolate cyclo-ligase, mitochondrial-like isoform X1 [Cucurbita moschata]|uniref:5-formyltetrahydrofolate cyclo-ligase n=1 Tax=Cucurbita moschata TaxID=3662 RepID=A0A6J1E1N0_CUCMO|nr:5-formyltetrahydrofolate cyclo-ligase, mitochondrial-like isoform X1 [Cucurbita moschata]
MIKSQLLQGNKTNLPVHGLQNSTTASRLTNPRNPAGVHVGRSPKARRRAVSESPMVRNYKLLPIAASSPFNRLPPTAFQPALRPLSRCSSRSPKMARNEGIKPENEEQLKALFEQKRVIRSSVRKALKAMDPSLRSQEDNAIQNIVLEAPWFKSSQRLCAYVSCSALREVDTSRILSETLQHPPKDGYSKKIYVPRVEDKNSHMRMFNISRMDDLIANSMNILEPAPVDGDGNEREDGNFMLTKDPIDLFLLPGLAFDKSGRRLGRGGGYYDTFLKNYQELAKVRNWKQPLLVALSYSVQIMDEGIIPLTPNDVLVDVLVSPSGVIPISSAGLDKMKV